MSLISGKPFSQYASCLLIFSPLGSIINQQQHESISTIYPAIVDNTIVKVHIPLINFYFKVNMSLDHGVSPRFVAFLAVWTVLETFQVTNNTRSIPASSALTQVSHWSHNRRTANRHQHGSGERNGEWRRTKVSFSRTMMQALELLWLAKRHISGGSDMEQCKNQARSLSGYWVTLVYRHYYVSEWVSQSVCLSVENSTKILKFCSNFLKCIRNDPKTVLSLAMPILYCLDVTK